MIKTLLISFLSISELIVSQEETEIFLKLKPNKNIKLVILELSWQRGPRHRHPAVSVRLIYRPDVSVAVCLRLVFFEAFWSFLSFWICMCEQVSLIGCLLWHHICRFSNPPPPASRPAPPLISCLRLSYCTTPINQLNQAAGRKKEKRNHTELKEDVYWSARADTRSVLFDPVL